MCGATGIEDVGMMKQFEKAALKLHCVFCGDTMFLVDVGRCVCLGCNTRQEIMVRFGDITGFEQFADDIVPEEVHIVLHSTDGKTNLLNELIKHLQAVSHSADSAIR